MENPVDQVRTGSTKGKKDDRDVTRRRRANYAKTGVDGKGTGLVRKQRVRGEKNIVNVLCERKLNAALWEGVRVETWPFGS